MLGVYREYTIDRYLDHESQWIRDFYWIDSIHYIIICCTIKQAKAFQQQHHFEIDLSFKMIQGDVNLFSIVSWDDDANCKFSICYTYTKHI